MVTSKRTLGFEFGAAMKYEARRDRAVKRRVWDKIAVGWVAEIYSRNSKLIFSVRSHWQEETGCESDRTTDRFWPKDEVELVYVFFFSESNLRATLTDRSWSGSRLEAPVVSVFDSSFQDQTNNYDKSKMCKHILNAQVRFCCESFPTSENDFVSLTPSKW